MHNKHPYHSLRELLIVILGVIVGLTLLLALFAKNLAPPLAPVKPLQVDLTPVAKVEVASVAGTQIEKSGEEVVKTVCATCHATGLLNAPKIGDKIAWKPRIDQGYATLVKHALMGIRMMPAKGGNSALNEKEIAEAVKFMTNSSGAKF